MFIMIYDHPSKFPQIVVGETGSGKSTQLTQYLLDVCILLTYLHLKLILYIQTNKVHVQENNFSFHLRLALVRQEESGALSPGELLVQYNFMMVSLFISVHLNWQHKMWK